MKYGVWLMENLTEESELFLAKQDNFNIFGPESSPKAEALHAIVARGKSIVDQHLIKSLPNLQVISKCGVGLDSIDVDFASSNGIQVLNTPGVNSDSVAEHTLSFILMLQRKMHTASSEVRKGNWNYRNQYSGDEIRDKTLGILGMGEIGQRVATLATCFGMKVQYWNRSEKSVPYGFRSLEQLIETSDIISIHLPLSPATKGLINKESIRKMKKGVLLINTARNGIIEENALIDSLKSGSIGGYAADVPFVDPPGSDHPLLAFENVLFTPHSSSLTKRTFDEICQLASMNVVSFLRGEKVEQRYKANEW
ncbi:2-hydroxyacid dehydrogenase [Portibacter marinus]|uniref:2-hydroxyacid dehydrogenase n=1 Tax=Portibacter marinus TaxID=2898660 RepID=UPI001F169B44|nr:NAD(P)-dependent oxidoreductase [Portibacter marinus]